MLTHRCPWCGKKIKVNIFEPWDLISRLANMEEKLTCTYCKKSYKIASGENRILFFLITIMGLELIQSIFYSKNNSLTFGFILILLCIVSFLYSLRIPYVRSNETKLKDNSKIFTVFTFFIAIVFISNINLQKHIVVYCVISILLIVSIIINFYLGKRKRS